MNEQQLEDYREHLLDLARRVKGDVSGLADEALRKTGGEASGNLSNAPLHLADLGTDNYDQGMSISLLANEQQTLDQINAALTRIAEGRFGCCEECHRDIDAERLQALPYVRFCVDCARRLEEHGEAGLVRAALP